MNKILTLAILLVARTIAVNGQCTADYSYSGTTDTLTFTNLSAVSNAHFYWNFGDGSGSNEVSPVHVYPDDGKYLVTLYGVDTLSQCVDVKEQWIDVVKPDTLDCQILFADTIIGGTASVTNLSTNCSGFNVNCSFFGSAQNWCGPTQWNGWPSALFMGGMQATTADSIYGFRIFNAYYKTIPWNYSSAINYQDCSANYEVVIDYQPTHAVATFTAMNKNATGYTFSISGFGNPIPLSGPSVSFHFNYNNFRRVSPTNVTLTITDTINNCQHQVTQQILIKNPNYTFPMNCVIFEPIQSQTAATGSDVQFFISASADASFQWQQDAGLGYMNLTNAGPYSGVNTNTLTISNVQTTMNNFQYRCIVYNPSGGCHNTSLPASLNIPLGLNNTETMGFKLYPNPTSSTLVIDLPDEVKHATLTVYSTLGQQHMRTTTSHVETTIDVAGLAKGVYVLEVSAGNSVGRQRFMKY